MSAPMPSDDDAQVIREALVGPAGIKRTPSLKEWQAALFALDRLLTLAAQAERYREALAAVDRVVRKPNGVIKNEWYWNAIHQVQGIVDVLPESERALIHEHANPVSVDNPPDALAATETPEEGE